MFGGRARNSYHGCDRVRAPSDAARRQPRANAPRTLCEETPHVRNRGQPDRHHQPADRRPPPGRRQQVRPGHLLGQACPPDQRLLQPAPGGPARLRRPARGDGDQREAPLDRAPRDQPGSRDRRGRSRGVTEPLRVVLGVGGGIAAYKAALLLRLFTESGHDVTVVPTAAALRFVGAPTWEALSGKPVSVEVWDDVHEVPHVRIGQSADLVVVAPATADLLAKAAHGRADDLLTNVLLTARCPVVFAPAMHTEMWEHPATQANVATLRERGALVVEPAVGRLTGVDTGKGRLPEPDELFALCQDVL